MNEAVIWRLAPMTATDVEAVQAIERQSFKQPWQSTAVAAELTAPGTIGLVATPALPEGGVLAAGYILSRCVVEELHLHRIAVAPQWRCRGAAATLLHHYFAAAVHRGARTVYLEVRPSNRPALTFYRKHGFELIAERPDYYTDSGEKALVLTKPLKEAA